MTKISMSNCSRCGVGHTDVETEKLEHPFAPPECAPVVWTHWARCPSNGQPIMVMLAGDDRDLGNIPSGTDHLEAALPVVYEIFNERRKANAIAAHDRDDQVALDTRAFERESFVSTVREFYGKWKPSA